jgi:hypothetical protein
MNKPTELQESPRNYDFVIIVNGREKHWFKEKISYSQVIVLAFGIVENTYNTAYSVIYNRGDNNMGIIVEGDEIIVSNNMRFNATQTSRS